MSYDFLFVEQELGALQTILQNKQIKANFQFSKLKNKTILLF